MHSGAILSFVIILFAMMFLMFCKKEEEEVRPLRPFHPRQSLSEFICLTCNILTTLNLFFDCVIIAVNGD